MAGGRITRFQTYQIPMPNAGQEYNWDIPAGIYGFRMQPQGATDIWIAFEAGRSGDQYWTIRQAPSRYFDIQDVGIVIRRDDASGAEVPQTMYFQSPVGGAILEIIAMF